MNKVPNQLNWRGKKKGFLREKVDQKGTEKDTIKYRFTSASTYNASIGAHIIQSPSSR